MKKLKIFVLLFAAALCSPIQAQDMFDESLRELERLNNITYDYVASFLEYPSNHENTLRCSVGYKILVSFMMNSTINDLRFYPDSTITRPENM